MRLTKYGISANLPKSAESAIIRKSRFLAITFVKMLVFVPNFAQSLLITIVNYLLKDFERKIFGQ